MQKTITLAFAVLAATSAAAVAQESFDWNGFYAGVHAGYGTGTTYLSNAIVNGTPMPVTPGNETQQATGPLGGVQVGGDMQIDGGLVLGLQGDVSLAAIRTNESGGDPDDTLNWLATATGRVGYAFDRILPYVEAGFAVGSATGHAVDVPATVIHTGWVVGGGVEFALAENVTVGVEYNYLEVGNSTYTFTGPSVGNISMDARHSVQTVKAGLNLRF